MQKEPTGIIERLKACESKPEIKALIKEFKGYTQASPKTTRKFYRNVGRMLNKVK